MSVLRWREAAEGADRAACARLRADVYVRERAWLPETRLSDGLECDFDDARSVHLLATRGFQPVGTVRLILRADEHPLPCEALLDDPLPALRSAAEVSRLAVAHEARGDSEVLIALCAGLYSTAVRHGIDDLYAMVEKRLHRHLVWLGFPFRRVGKPQWIYESWNYVIAMEVPLAKPRLQPALDGCGGRPAEEVLDVRAA
jgi:N-acyl-L-homoserine lactone synthetase